MNEIKDLYLQAVRNLPILRYSWVLVATICILALAAYFKLQNSDVFFYAFAVLGVSIIGFVLSFISRSRDRIVRIAVYILVFSIVITAGAAVLGFASFIFVGKPEFFNQWFPDDSRKTTTTNYYDVADVIDSKPTIDELKAELHQNKSALASYLKSDDYENLFIINSLKVDSVTFDMFIYYYNDEMNQMGRHIALIDFYEIDPIKVPWEKIDQDWNKKYTKVRWGNLKETLEKTNGFNLPLEYTNNIGPSVPRVIYIQLCGRRSELNQVDLATMEHKNDFIRRNDLFRIVGTYDLMVGKFRPFL